MNKAVDFDGAMVELGLTFENLEQLEIVNRNGLLFGLLNKGEAFKVMDEFYLASFLHVWMPNGNRLYTTDPETNFTSNIQIITDYLRRDGTFEKESEAMMQEWEVSNKDCIDVNITINDKTFDRIIMPIYLFENITKKEVTVVNGPTFKVTYPEEIYGVVK